MDNCNEKTPKQILLEKLSDTIIEFEKQTGCDIVGIDVERLWPMSISDPDITIHGKITVRTK